jgi:type VI secretion system secreted protein VgrG
MSLLDAATKAIAGQLPGLLDLSSLLSSFASAFLQTTRSLKLHCAAASGIPANLLLPQRLTGHTEINGEFRYVLDTLCADVHVELKSILATPVELTVRTDAGTEQVISGIVTEVSQTGSEGGFASFRLVIESALSVLQHRVTARVFTKTNVRALTAQIIGEHLERNAVLADCFVLEDRCCREYPEQPFWMQYNKSDAAYLRRLWAREGISFVILPAEGSSADHPQHRLVLFDDVMDLDVNASATVRFHRADGTEQTDAITQWHAHRVLQSGKAIRSQIG